MRGLTLPSVPSSNPPQNSLVKDREVTLPACRGKPASAYPATTCFSDLNTGRLRGSSIRFSWQCSGHFRHRVKQHKIIHQKPWNNLARPWRSLVQAQKITQSEARRTQNADKCELCPPQRCNLLLPSLLNKEPTGSPPNQECSP